MPRVQHASFRCQVLGKTFFLRKGDGKTARYASMRVRGSRIRELLRPYLHELNKKQFTRQEFNRHNSDARYLEKLISCGSMSSRKTQPSRLLFSEKTFVTGKYTWVKLCTQLIRNAYFYCKNCIFLHLKRETPQEPILFMGTPLHVHHDLDGSPSESPIFCCEKLHSLVYMTRNPKKKPFGPPFFL